MKYLITTVLTLLCVSEGLHAQVKNKKNMHNPIAVIGYYAGGAAALDSFEIKKLTHIIFSFCHLKGNLLSVANAADTLTIQKMIALKKHNPALKVILSMGGWGGCESCSDVFSTKKGRTEFAQATKATLNYFGADGIDLDWEYPAVEGYPKHRYQLADKQNFTALLRDLRTTLGSTYEISFAAGISDKCIDGIDWKGVEPYITYVNLMSYDIIHGYSKQTGHHTALYTTKYQPVSADRAVHILEKNGIPSQKIILGAAFYARIFDSVPNVQNGLYQKGSFLKGISYKEFATTLTPKNGYQFFWDSIAHAPYQYNATKNWFVTYDNEKSIRDKTLYTIQNNLGGIMFWQLSDDTYNNGLLHQIDAVKNKINN